MSDRRCPECFEILECPSCDPSITHMAHDFEEDGLREAAQPFLEAALNVFPEEWISPGSSYAISITVRGSEVDALRAALRATPETPCRCGKPESDPIHGPQSSALDHAFEAALRSTPAAPTHTPKVMEAEAGRLLVESARIRAARLGPDDAHELRHLWAAINAGNSDPCGETCHLDADAIARWTEQYPKVMGLAALRPTPAAPLHPHDGYSYDGCKCVCCLNIRALATPAAQKPDAGLREALADQIATLYGWTAHEQASPRQRALYVLWREWHALVGERTEHPALSDERIESLSRQRAEECAALRSTPAAPKPDARSLADRITGVIAIPPDGEVEP